MRSFASFVGPQSGTRTGLLELAMDHFPPSWPQTWSQNSGNLGHCSHTKDYVWSGLTKSGARTSDSHNAECIDLYRLHEGLQQRRP